MNHLELSTNGVFVLQQRVDFIFRAYRCYSAPDDLILRYPNY